MIDNSFSNLEIRELGGVVFDPQQEYYCQFDKILESISEMDGAGYPWSHSDRNRLILGKDDVPKEAYPHSV